MGRRALRKIDPELDLSSHFKTVEDLPRPLNPQQLFCRVAPLEIEIGSGKGLFVYRSSGAHPHHNYLGNEIARKYARFAAARLARDDRDNAVMAQGDGLAMFRECLPENCANDVHVYFPDPWWKKRHKKRRVMTESFLLDVQRVLVNGGTLHFWTDVQEYFETTLELITATTSLTGPFDVPEVAAEHDMDYHTHFERRMRLNGEPIYRAEFRKD